MNDFMVRSMAFDQITSVLAPAAPDECRKDVPGISDQHQVQRVTLLGAVFVGRTAGQQLDRPAQGVLIIDFHDLRVVVQHVEIDQGEVALERRVHQDIRKAVGFFARDEVDVDRLEGLVAFHDHKPGTRRPRLNRVVEFQRLEVVHDRAPLYRSCSDPTGLLTVTRYPDSPGRAPAWER